MIRLRRVRVAALALLPLLLLACQSERTPPPLFVLGVDGATWDVIDELIAAGELPNFARIKREGAFGDLITVGPQVSPVVWTTIATGRFGREHGILDFVFPYTPGPKKPVESLQRRSPALWNIASAAGKRVGVLGYFASFPAEPVNGVLLSDRPFGENAGRYHPPSYEPVLAPYLAEYFDTAHRLELWRRYFDWDHDPVAAPEDPRYAEAHRLVTGRVDQSILFSELVRDTTLALLDEKEPFDLLVSYHRVVDFASHSLWWYHDPTDFEDEPDPFTRELLGDVIRESYRYMDDVLGEILARIGEDTNLVIVSDHGFGSATGQFAVRGDNPFSLSGNHRPDGIFAAWGPDIAAGELAAGMTILDIFPLLAVLSGLSVADDLPGQVPLESVRAAFFDDFPLTTVASYGARRNAVADDVALSESDQLREVESLRGLGYIGEGFTFGERDDMEADFFAAEPSVLVYHLVGEIVFALLRGNRELADSLVDELRAKRPEMADDVVMRVGVNFDILDDRLDGSTPNRDLAQAFLDDARRSAGP